MTTDQKVDILHRRELRGNERVVVGIVSLEYITISSICNVTGDMRYEMIRDIITKSILLFTVFALVMSSTSCSGNNTNGEYGTNPSGSDGSGNITTNGVN